MTAQPDTARRGAARAATAAVCALLVAAGGVLVAAPAHAAEPADACSTTTGDLPGGVVLSGSRLTIGLLGCATTGQTGGAATAAPVDTTRPVPTSAPSAPVDVVPAGSAPTDPTDGRAVSTSSTGSAPTPASTRVAIRRSSAMVYPVKDGYLDVVRFSVWGAGEAGGCIPLDGRAVLTHAGRTVKTWALHGTGSVLSWNGRVKSAVRPGLYTLHVAATAPDGTDRSGTTTVRVMPERLARRTLMIRTDVGAEATSAELPKRLIGAYRLGRVTIATRTVAVVRGTAKLVFSNDGHRKVLRLRDGVHTTNPTVLPRSFERVTIRHAWKRGAARLQSLQAIWTYSVLE
ncbi:hypothetical protein [Amnibacterium kyonggiense]|uniref:FlgD-like protein n=1 Tax=Amnibacterium kyonggiense TaxID=595671 RepID=A0A4R7FQF2_9MICO|nr:hypothetical protein [Amnibacterium kyonggiense]TDS79973.1 hypothetical protein CLV52_0519 [Amnibacterium kyonggiense]